MSPQGQSEAHRAVDTLYQNGASSITRMKPAWARSYSDETTTERMLRIEVESRACNTDSNADGSDHRLSNLVGTTKSLLYISTRFGQPQPDLQPR
jgi:hypothetical protein